MGNCIICGTSTDGPICDTHQEDVVFEFRGSRPEHLTEGRFYRGTVDGYADFGVFVDLNDRVTGLLHRSKLDRRLESLDWEAGDTVFVQVTNIRENGDVDLGWSIRQSEREFRGTLIDDPEGDRLADEAESETTAESEPAAESEPTAEPGQGPEPGPEPESEPGVAGEVSDEAPGGEPRAGTTSGESTGTGDAGTEERAPVERVDVQDLREQVGDTVRLEGEIVSVRQTSGPTVFELRDETAVVDCAAFVEAGVRAYPEVETGDVVRLEGEVRVRRDELQVETEELVVLADEEREAVEARMADALTSEARPGTVEALAEDEAVEAVLDDVEAVATAIRRAVLESRPVVVRHAATADGYVAGAAIERAVLPLVAEEHAATDATYHYFDRRPLEGTVYTMDDATRDVTGMLDDRERHDEKLPLVVFAAAGGTRDSQDGLDLLSVYGVERVVVDGRPVDDEVRDTVGTVVAPEEPRSAATVAATVAGAVNDVVREDLRHLPAVSYWDEPPAPYGDLAAETGLDPDAVDRLREAIALEAYYQSYEDKRQLIIDLLFDRRVGLAEQVSEQFRTKLAAELDTAEANVERREVGDVTFDVLDTDAFTHRFDFPPATLLLDELHRRDGATVTVGVAKDELHVRSDADVDVRAVAERVAERVPEGGVAARGAREGRIEFLAGEREAVLDAVVETVAEHLSAAPEA